MTFRDPKYLAYNFPILDPVATAKPQGDCLKCRFWGPIPRYEIQPLDKGPRHQHL